MGNSKTHVPHWGPSRESLSSRLRAVALLRASVKTGVGNRNLFSSSYSQHRSSSWSFPTLCNGNLSPAPSFPTFFIGNPSWIRFGWIPATNCGDDGNKMDTCQQHAGMTAKKWMPAPANDCRSKLYDRRHDK